MFDTTQYAVRFLMVPADRTHSTTRLLDHLKVCLRQFVRHFTLLRHEYVLQEEWLTCPDELNNSNFECSSNDVRYCATMSDIAQWCQILLLKSCIQKEHFTPLVFLFTQNIQVKQQWGWESESCKWLGLVDCISCTAENDSYWEVCHAWIVFHLFFQASQLIGWVAICTGQTPAWIAYLYQGSMAAIVEHWSLISWISREQLWWIQRPGKWIKVCVCVCVKMKKRGPDEWQALQAKITSAIKRKVQYRTGRGPFRQSSHCHPDKRKRERLSTKSTHVTVYLFRDLNWDRSRLLWMTVGPKGQYSAKRRTRKRQSSKTFKRWSNLHRRRPLAVLRTSGVIVHLAPGASRRALGYVRSNFGTRTLLAHAQRRRKKKKNQSSKKEGRKIKIREKKCDPTVQISVSMR